MAISAIRNHLLKFYACIIKVPNFKVLDRYNVCDLQIPSSIQEVLDLSDFDIDFAPQPEDDVASIRNVRTTLTATGAASASARVTSVGNPGKCPKSL